VLTISKSELCIGAYPHATFALRYRQGQMRMLTLAHSTGMNRRTNSQHSRVDREPADCA